MVLAVVSFIMHGVFIGKATMKTCQRLDQTNLDRLRYISDFLKGYRINSGITQEELSQLSKLHRNTIVRIESGKNVTLLSVFEIADALDVNLQELLYDIR
jgi:DNA-binding XRE family transcriptional regulator